MMIIEHEFKHKPYTQRKKTTEITMHCAATPEGKDYTVETINKWHNDRSFNGIGYHYVIYRDGSIHRGRPEEVVGAHCVSTNSKAIGICYIGGCAADGKTAKDTRTDAQKQAQYELIEELLKKYNLTINDVKGHRDYDPKACPSYTSQQFRDEYNKWKEQKYADELREKNKRVPITFCFLRDWFSH